MLAMSDISLDRFLPLFAQTNVPVAFLVPTPTGYGKSIMDATGPVRELLKSSGVHNYETQKQGTESKVLKQAYLVEANKVIRTEASLYRPQTKQGDPRIWIYGLKNYCRPCNLLALIVVDDDIYVFNLSNPAIANSLLNKGFAYSFVQDAADIENAIANELLSKLRDIHNQGFLRSITSGDPGVGDTLENALGITRNNRQTPDYKGIELKTTRLTRNGTKRPTTRVTLFTKVPDIGMTYRQILDTYGKIQIPHNATEPRFQLYETCRVSRPNAYGLQLSVDNGADNLNLIYNQEKTNFVSAWHFETLKSSLLAKHRETFWIKAISETRNGVEYFRYDKVLHTKSPNAMLLPVLFETDKITVDLAAHYKPNGLYKDHGVLFKMQPDDLSLLLGVENEYTL